MAAENQWDVVILGAGPAGTAAAAVLAERGKRALLVERERFPRYRIGESLIPYCYFPLQRLGMIEKLRSSHFVKKYSVQFVSMDGRASQPFYFSQHWDHPCSQTWQVERGEFDQMLLDNALEKGAQILWEASARDLIIENGAVKGVVVKEKSGGERRLRAPITIDATGRDGFAINKLGWRVPDQELKKVALWTYYEGAMRDSGQDEGATTVAFVPEKGWFWYIPLARDKVSVGIVAEREYLYRNGKDLERIFNENVDRNAWVKEHVSTGRRVADFRVTGDYSYRARHSSMDGLALAGDAFAFLDPVFSSGVFLALRSGEMVADAAVEALDAGDVSAGRFGAYAKELCAGIEAMRRLVYAFYDHSFRFSDLLGKYPDLKGDLTDCLIGNLQKDFDPLFNAVKEFASVPDPLAHGLPMAVA